MLRKILRSITWGGLVTYLALCSNAVFAAAFASYPVVVISETNNGDDPPDCRGILDQAGGPPEVTLDLDNDGIQDICLGSNSTTCANPVNIDCAESTLGSNGSLCSHESTNFFMGGDPTVTTNNGNPVGDDFRDEAVSVSASLLGEPLVIGFQGVSSNAALTGYFEMQIDDVDGTNCSYSFGNAYVDDGVEGLNYGDTPPEPPSRGAVPVPTMPLYGLVLTAVGLLLVAWRGIGRRG